MRLVDLTPELLELVLLALPLKDRYKPFNTARLPGCPVPLSGRSHCPAAAYRRVPSSRRCFAALSGCCLPPHTTAPASHPPQGAGHRPLPQAGRPGQQKPQAVGVSRHLHSL